MRHRLFARVLATLLILWTMVGCASGSQPTQSRPAGFDLALEDLQGKPARVSDYRGRVVMINFWAIWCAPCRAEMADLDAVYRQYRDKGVVILAVNVAENSSDISTFATNMGLTLPIFRDSQQRITKAYNINALPTTFFIDRQGQMRRRQIGMMSRDFMVQQIESLLH